MKSMNSPVYRVRRFTREILLASAITLAAIVVLTLSREETEVAEAPSSESTPAPSRQ
ncbi:MAG: hypothetical protein MUE84_08605 [Hyphomonas sp.]|nr:hypothetical protein [Hyphomonas sp.]